MRLSEGAHGRVELYSDSGGWGTVCHKAAWNKDRVAMLALATVVVCCELGYDPRPGSGGLLRVADLPLGRPPRLDNGRRGSIGAGWSRLDPARRSGRTVAAAHQLLRFPPFPPPGGGRRRLPPAH